MSHLPKIAYMVDGGGNVGLGHIQQALAFAEVLKHDLDITFFTKSSESVVEKIQSNGYPVVHCQTDSIFFSNLVLLRPAVVIFDKIDVDEGLARDIREKLKFGLIIFTNLTNANQYANYAITAGIGSEFKNISYKDSTSSTRYFFGPKYWILRQEFYKYSLMKKDAPNNISRVLLLFGGSDPANVTSESLLSLLQSEHSFVIDIIIGSSFMHHNDLYTVMHKYPEKTSLVTIHENTNNVASLMFNSDVVVSSPGLSAFEALKVGTPIILVPQNKMQNDAYVNYFKLLRRTELHMLPLDLIKGNFTCPYDSWILNMEIGSGIEELKHLVLELARVKYCHE